MWALSYSLLIKDIMTSTPYMSTIWKLSRFLLWRSVLRSEQWNSSTLHWYKLAQDVYEASSWVQHNCWIIHLRTARTLRFAIQMCNNVMAPHNTTYLSPIDSFSFSWNYGEISYILRKCGRMWRHICGCLSVLFLATYFKCIKWMWIIVEGDLQIPIFHNNILFITLHLVTRHAGLERVKM